MTQQPREDLPGRKSRLRSLEWWSSLAGVMTAVGTGLAALSLAVAIGAWLRPQNGAADGRNNGAASSGSSGLFRTPWLGLEFWHGDTRVPMVEVPNEDDADTGREVVRVDVGTKPFQMRVPKLPREVAVQVCGWIDDSIFILEQGRKIEDIPFLQPGTGMADTAAGSGSLLVTNQAQNYFAGRRIASLSSEQDGVYVSSIGYPYWVDASVPPLQPTTDVYLAIHIDLNNDDIVDHDEYEYVLLNR